MSPANGRAELRWTGRGHCEWKAPTIQQTLPWPPSQPTFRGSVPRRSFKTSPSNVTSCRGVRTHSQTSLLMEVTVPCPTLLLPHTHPPALSVCCFSILRKEAFPGGFPKPSLSPNYALNFHPNSQTRLSLNSQPHVSSQELSLSCLIGG